MHTDMAKLKGKIAEKSMTQEDVAAKIGINSSTFSRKMKSDGLSFTVGQIHRLIELLDLTPQEAVHIFCSKTRNNASNEIINRRLRHS